MSACFIVNVISDDLVMPRPYLHILVNQGRPTVITVEAHILLLLIIGLNFNFFLVARFIYGRSLGSLTNRRPDNVTCLMT